MTTRMTGPFTSILATLFLALAAASLALRIFAAALFETTSSQSKGIPLTSAWTPNHDQFSVPKAGRASAADVQAALASSALAKASSNAKLGLILTDLAMQRQQQQGPVVVPGTKPVSDGLATTVDGDVLVEIVGASAIEGVLAQALATVCGVKVTGCFQRVCSAYVALDRSEAVASLSDVEFLRPSVRASDHA